MSAKARFDPAEGAPRRSQIAEGSVVGSVEENWGDEERQDELGWQFEMRRSRNERQCGATDRQQRGIRYAHPPPEGREYRRSQEQRQKSFKGV